MFIAFEDYTPKIQLSQSINFVIPSNILPVISAKRLEGFNLVVRENLYNKWCVLGNIQHRADLSNDIDNVYTAKILRIQDEKPLA